MRVTKFCSECGERIEGRRKGLLTERALCSRCSPRFNRSRILLLAMLAFSAAAGFLLGRHVAPRETFYLIGSPIDRDTGKDGLSPSENKLSKETDRIVSLEAPCGARTKSGRPCRRKVRGGGHCWQHRKKAAAN